MTKLKKVMNNSSQNEINKYYEKKYKYLAESSV